jgi:uncharacterized protein (TIGR02145 family)
MRKVFTLLVAVLLTTSVFAQSPEKMSYQAVIRNSSDALVTNTQVGMQISILQGSASGTAVYVETQTPTTNANGLVSIEIGAGTVVSGDFTTIDWANGPYFIKTETDPAGGTNYSITGTSQLLSVPYAMHAKMAETVSGGITETDPVYGSSVAGGITGADTASWNNKLDSYTETDPVFGSSVAGGITGADTASWNNKLDSYTETDPVFGLSVAGGITGADTANWNNKLDSYTETDPSVPAGTQTGEIQYWNGNEWVTVAPASSNGQALYFIDNKPQWGPLVSSTDVINSTTGKVWMDRNLGASQVATSSTDAAAYGDLYQWGRSADGHEHRNSAIHNGDVLGFPSTATESGDWDGKFILSGVNSPFDWLSSYNHDLWQGVGGTNNPCPSSYRLPTNAEWAAEIATWNSQDNDGAFNSLLKLPVAGFRSNQHGGIVNAGSNGRYWSSNVDVNESKILYFNDSDANVSSTYRASGYSVRCIKE